MKPSVLIVEDEAIIAMGLQYSLEAMGYEILGITGSAETAFEMMHEQKPDLVLMDIHLSGEIDGLTCAERLRARWDSALIFLTAFSDTKTVERAKRLRPLAYLTKPVDDTALRIALAHALPDASPAPSCSGRHATTRPQPQLQPHRSSAQEASDATPRG